MLNQYKHPDGDVVEATPHEFVTRLKKKGYVLVREQDVELTEGTPEVEHVAVDEGTEDQVPESVPEVQKERRNPRQSDGPRQG